METKFFVPKSLFESNDLICCILYLFILIVFILVNMQEKQKQNSEIFSDSESWNKECFEGFPTFL